MIGSRWTVAAVLVGLAGLAGCDSGDDDAQRMPLNGNGAMAEARAGWTPEYGALIDGGNEAYRSGNYDQAADHFRRATDAEPQIAAGWFGLHMAETALGNQEAATEALNRAEALTPGLGGGHPTGPGESPQPGMELPPGHP